MAYDNADINWLIDYQTIRDLEYQRIGRNDKFLIINDDGSVSHLDISLVKEHQLDNWRPKSVVYHQPDFYNWIDSINSGFQNRIQYNPFTVYCQQADYWLRDNKDISYFESESERRDYSFSEFDRCSKNSLYAANKYHFLQESSMPNGRRKYFATSDYEHHRVVLFLLDCGYSILLGKPRQIGSTSIIGIWAVNRSLHYKNHYVKFIAEKGEKTESIFNQKIKFPFSSLPNFMKHNVVNDRDNLFRLGEKTKKGDISGINSTIEVAVPEPTAINGKSPDVVLIDEIGTIPILTEMMNEGRPSMLWKNPITRQLEIRRMIVMWGTGTTGKGGGAFESEWNKTHNNWLDRSGYNIIVPVFFDWTTRCSQEEYDLQKKEYYAGNADIGDNVSIETSKIMFHQHYPTTPSDMFTSTDKILVSREIIDSSVKRIADARNKGVFVKYGYFVPVYDTNVKYDEDKYDTPYKVIGAEFIPCDTNDHRATVGILAPPEEDWVDRYYQGTDPINADTGISNMASVIWDEYYHTPAAILNAREANNPKHTFLQCLLLNLYYSKFSPVKELVEKNQGLSYVSYKEHHGFWDTMMMNGELPEYYQSGEGSNIGIDNKGNRAKLIINRMTELFNSYHNNIFHPIVFEQLKTFVCKITRAGNETWGTLDARYYHDDVLYGLVYSYIAANSFNMYKIPTNIKEKKKEKKVEYRLQYDEQWNQTRVRVEI